MATIRKHPVPTQDNADDRKRRTIDVLISGIQSNIETYAKTLSDLELRLEPILAQEVTSDDDSDSKVSEFISPMYESLRTVTRSLYTLNSRLQSVIDRTTL